jgi:anti-sigma regulatory factor (Ser/Thr protein kinase)
MLPGCQFKPCSGALLTIPGEPAHLHEVREFVARAVEYACPEVDTAVLLTSELVTNSLQHSNSRCPGGTVTISVLAVPDGVVIEVIDDGGASVRPWHPASRASRTCLKAAAGCGWSRRSRRAGATTATLRAPSPGSS